MASRKAATASRSRVALDDAAICDVTAGLVSVSSIEMIFYDENWHTLRNDAFAGGVEKHLVRAKRNRGGNGSRGPSTAPVPT